MPLPDPVCLSVVLCDQVIEDKRTGKKSLIGVFNEIHVGHLPATHGCMFLLVTLTNCRGSHELKIEFTRDGEYDVETVMEMRGQIKADNPLAIIDLVFEMRGIPFARAGRYTIDITSLTTKNRLAQRFFFIRHHKTPPPQSPPLPGES